MYIRTRACAFFYFVSAALRLTLDTPPSLDLQRPRTSQRPPGRSHSKIPILIPDAPGIHTVRFDFLYFAQPNQVLDLVVGFQRASVC